jgi:hypothetical protein
MLADLPIPTDWTTLVGSIGAAGAVIWTVRVFLARQEKSAEECKAQVQAIVEANNATVAGIVAANERNNERFAEALAANTLEVSGLRKDIGTVIQRNERKDSDG